MKSGICLALAALLAVALTCSAGAATGVNAGGATAPLSGQALFTDDDLLLFEVTSQGFQLSDGLSGYSSRGGIYLPLGEMTRLLDFAIVVDPATQKADGWFLSKDRTFVLDLKSRKALVAGQEFTLSDTDAALFHNEIYVRSDLWEKFFPLTLNVSKSDLTIDVVPREALPFQERLEREKRRKALGAGGAENESVLRLPSSYALFTPPSADLTLNGAISNQSPKLTGDWELRLGGDIAYSGAQVFVGSDEAGKPTSVRAFLERKDPDGQVAGFFGATKSDAGDVFTPSLALGAASQGGRGISTTSVPLDEASVFSTTDLRGELPLGYEVELYVNEILRGSQSQPVRGNYEFLSVPLSYGVNVIRLVFYGPRGERREEVRHINVGSGQLHKGQFVYSLGATQDRLPLIDISDAGKPIPGTFGVGSLRTVASASYGLTDDFTFAGGFAHYTPNAIFDHRERSVFTGGLLTSLLGFALDFEAAGDTFGDTAYAAGAGGKLFDASLLTRHTEYSGSFVDELQFRDLSAPAPLRRATDAIVDWAAPIPWTGLGLPISLHGQRTEFVDGSERLLGELHASVAVDRYLLSGSWQYERTTKPSGPAALTSQGTADASAFVWRSWQLRSEAVFSSIPKLRIASASATINGNLTDWASIQLGATHSFAQTIALPTAPGTPNPCIPGSGSVSGGCPPAIGSTSVNGSATLHLSKFDFSFNGNYVPETHEYRFGLQLALGALFDPLAGEYQLARPGAAAGGTAAIDVFVDKNGNGQRDPDEAGLPGVKAQASNWPAESDSNGDLLVGGLGDPPRTRIRIDQDSISDPYLTSPAPLIEVVPHPGRVAIVPYPLRSMGEVQLKFLFMREGEAPRGLSALAIQAIGPDGKVVSEGRTEYDGTLILERLPSGTYVIRIDPAQAARLKLTLTAPLTITIPPKGGYIGLFKSEVVLAQ